MPYLLVRRRWTAAAALVGSSVAFAVVPAVQVGWPEIGRQWATAVGGLTGMAGVGHGGERAEVHKLADSLSCSVTSALARATGSPLAALSLAALLAAGLFAAAAWAYRRRSVPLLGPPSDAAVTAAEWPTLVAVLLAFSPQTNTRHLYDALLVTTAAAVLLLAPAAGVRRGPLAAGVAVLALGFTLPPGSRTAAGAWSPVLAWLRLGGPCWCLLVAAASLLWTGLAQARSLETKASEGSTTDGHG